MKQVHKVPLTTSKKMQKSFTLSENEHQSEFFSDFPDITSGFLYTKTIESNVNKFGYNEYPLRMNS